MDIPVEGIVHDDDRDLIDAGYQPQLHRTLSFFPSFAIGFSFMSVLMGTFANYGYVLNKAGPFGFWTWPIVGIGQLLVALVFAEMASRLPLTGSLYNWNSRLSNPTVAWLVAWVLAFAYTIAAPGTILVMMAPLQTLLGIEFESNTIFLIAAGVIIVQLLINIYGIRFAAYINWIAVISELIALAVFGSLLGLVLVFKGGAHPEFLTTIPHTTTPYVPAFLMSTLLAAYTIFGFESPSDLSEETLRVKHVAPKSIISSVLVSVVVGRLFIGILTLSIPNLAVVTAAADPISTIVSYHLGILPTNIFLVCVLIAIFATSLLNITLASRLLFAVARDEHFIAASFFKKISSRKVPANAAVIVALIGIITFYFLSGLTALYAAPVVLLFIAYLVTVINFARNQAVLPETTTFSLGVWHWPVTILAIIWLVAEIGILTIPDEFHLAAYISIGVVAFGALQYGAIKYFRREEYLRN